MSAFNACSISGAELPSIRPLMLTRTQRFNSDDVISMDTHPPVVESVISVWRAGKKERAADQSAALFQL